MLPSIAGVPMLKGQGKCGANIAISSNNWRERASNNADIVEEKLWYQGILFRIIGPTIVVALAGVVEGIFCVEEVKSIAAIERFLRCSCNKSRS